MDILQRNLHDSLDPELFDVPMSALGRCTRREYPPSLPKNTLNGGNMNVAVAPRHPLLDRYHGSKSGGAQRSSHLCRRRKGAMSICERISYSSHCKSDLAYVFHAPDINITTSRLSTVAASVLYCLNGVSNAIHPGESLSRTHTVMSRLCGVLCEVLRANFHNHRLAHPPGRRLASLSPQPLRLQIRAE